MRKDVLDPGPAVSGPEKEVGPGAVKEWNFEHGWPSKWVGPDQAADVLPQDTIGRLEGADVTGLLLPAVQKVAPAENMPFIFNKITDPDSVDALEQIGDSFDENVVFLDPGGEQGAAGVFVKIGDIKGETQDDQDMGGWSPLSDFSDSDIFF